MFNLWSKVRKKGKYQGLEGDDFDDSDKEVKTGLEMNDSEEDNKDGMRTLKYARGNIRYFGQMHGGLFHGEGTLYFDLNKSQIEYQGWFRDGKYHGAGVQLTDDNKVYRWGNWRNGFFDEGMEYVPLPDGVIVRTFKAGEIEDETKTVGEGYAEIVNHPENIIT